MASMHEVAVYLGRGLARRLGEERRAAVLAYGLEIILGTAVEVALILILARWLGLLRPTALCLAAACSLRLFSGGNHCTAYYRCVLLSLLVFLSLGWAARLLAAVVPPLFLFLVSLGTVAGALAAVLALAPVEDPKRIRLKPAVRRRRRVCSVVSLAGWAVLLAFALRGEAAVAVGLGLAWQSFNLTAAGRSAVAFVDGLLVPLERR